MYLLVAFGLVCLLESGGAGQNNIYNQCDTIKEQICQGIQYRQTRMPNLVGITSQTDAAKRLFDYYPLITVQCSEYLKLFLCTVYFPMCVQLESDAVPSVLSPCRNLCVYVQSRCEQYMRLFNLSWPKELNCNRLPQSDSLCIQPKNYELDKNRTVVSSVDISQLKKLYPSIQNMAQLPEHANLQIPLKPAKTLKEKFCLDSHDFIGSSTLNATNFTRLKHCFLRCEADFLYRKEDKHLTRIWLGFWAALGLISSVVAVLAFGTEEKARFRYPERPIVFIVVCYGCVCATKLLEIGVGREAMSCYRRPQLQQHQDPLKQPLSGISVLARDGYEGPWCTVSFLATYYCEMAAAVWWLMLAISCFLSSARQWSWESVEKVSSLMHLAAWTLPAVQATTVLLTRRIEGDELLGSCYVGRLNLTGLILFILFPRMLYFLLGLVLLVISFRSLLLLRKKLRADVDTDNTVSFKNQQSLDKFIVKTAIFCGVYGVPMNWLIGCQLYYYWHLERWRHLPTSLAAHCASTAGIHWHRPGCGNETNLPLVEVRLLEIFSSLILGITSAMWMWCNRKTLGYLRGRHQRCLPPPVARHKDRSLTVL